MEQVSLNRRTFLGLGALAAGFGAIGAYRTLWFHWPGRLKLASQLPNAAQPPVFSSTTPFEQTVWDHNEFALAFYHTLRTELTGNLFYSPYSIWQTLAMVYLGARSDTAQQMADALHFTQAAPDLLANLQQIRQRLTTNNQAESFQLQMANALWVQQGYEILPEFLDPIVKNDPAALQQVDFSQASELARGQINQWVSQATENKINELIPDGGVSPATRLVLANAIYLQATWTQPFEATLAPPAFTLLDGQSVAVPMMQRQGMVRLFEDEQLQAVGLEYQGSSVQMIILQPRAGYFGAVEQALDQKQVATISASLVETHCTLVLPKFTFEFDLNLAEDLQRLGMADAFDATRADFTGITQTEALYISQVFHKAFIAVNEQGTEAAAATAAVMSNMSYSPSPPKTVVIDHPFIFVLHDPKSKAILFVGRLLNPL